MKPTRARYWVIFFAITLGILSYIDRVAISQAAKPISDELGLTKSQMGLVFGAFGISYALFEIPTGWLADWMGPRRVLIRVVLWWSSFTALTGTAWSYGSLWTIRFLFGVGEAGCFPVLTKAFSVWLPQDEKSRAQGLLWSFARWGGAFTPPLVILVFKFVSWRYAFAVFGALGLVWCFFFGRWFRDRPQDHPSVNAAELELLKHAETHGHADVPWMKLIRSRSVVLLWVQYFCLSFPWYFYVTWLPTYLQEFRHQTPAASARLAIFPLLFGGFGSLLCGLLAPRVARSMGDLTRARRTISVTGFLSAAVFLWISTRIDDPLLGMLMMGVASFANDLTMPCSWNSCMDIGGKYAGTVAGSMNMMGNLAAFAAPAFGGILLDRTHNDWNLLLLVMVVVYVAGAMCWPFIDPVTKIESQREVQLA
jgi:ACS family glucarate transporter-like MFS transporter